MIDRGILDARNALAELQLPSYTCLRAFLPSKDRPFVPAVLSALLDDPLDLFVVFRLLFRRLGPSRFVSERTHSSLSIIHGRHTAFKPK